MNISRNLMRVGVIVRDHKSAVMARKSIAIPYIRDVTVRSSYRFLLVFAYSIIDVRK